ncbi:hypothetical protein BBJ28_00001518 [Nothophytophthora sp. Chile5]|nr:hypothetical protein BBJ28_00001518 [Nothophytophthora sp. Chile5]
MLGEHEVVRVSAPGKLLLLGEHAVVYGCPVVAAVLSDLRVKAEIVRGSLLCFMGFDEDGVAAVEFSCKDITSTRDKLALRRAYPMSELLKVVEGLEDESCYVPTPMPAVMTRIKAVLGVETPEDAKALLVPMFLCCALLRSSGILNGYVRFPGRGGLHVEVSTSNLPIGAGLGSSAALSVALSGAFAELSGSPRKHELDFINAYAYAAEVILHGSPSGADNTVSCFGGTLVFQKLPKPSFRRISCELNDFRFLLVNTRVPRSTKVQVGNVRKKYDADRAKLQQQFDSIQQIVEEFVTLSEQKLLSEEMLAREIGKNQEILNSLGVGHPQIDEVERICKQFGGVTKLTGAGGGGCTISILPRSMSDGDMQTLVGELEAKGFGCFISSIGGPGLIRA